MVSIGRFGDSDGTLVERNGAGAFDDRVGAGAFVDFVGDGFVDCVGVGIMGGGSKVGCFVGMDATIGEPVGGAIVLGDFTGAKGQIDC